ncbi:bifunctional 3,4-dihydroxy-2-butanone 4-phosphate synthase/GTP cyclohydrolase II [Devosia elaeis]|uniref:Multifunctional fusion protein n=2 Tax=Devosia elaeis TaxID=1770058 RepID=A0A178HJG9_9HYPH|nr:bifunctional 3,4-dihydroxy-2-butanone 4-phosphate synthase/GTP cyclohydrolase II [Devosia elaeis]
MHALSQALSALQAGRMIVLVDDEDRENEGDLILPAQFATPEAVNFMAMHGRGLICLALEGAQVDHLGLDPMVRNNRTRRSTAFTVSIEAREGITTGISAADRAHTMKLAASTTVQPDDIVSPGHVFPLRAVEGGVLARNGHTEGAVDLVRLAGLQPGSVICEIMRDDGQMARRDDLIAFAKRHDLVLLTVRDIVEHRIRTEQLVEEIASADLPSAFASSMLRLHAFRNSIDGIEHIAAVKSGDALVPLVRLHSECLTGDALGSLRCDCGPQLQKAMQEISDSDGGALIYLRGHEGRGIGLGNKIRAYDLQDRGHDTIVANQMLGHPVDAREYWVGAQMLKALGFSRIRLLTNNPDKAEALERYGIVVEQCLPLVIPANPFNQNYMTTKRDRLGHTLATL